jgi:RNA polymerase sigma-70 factor (ECF subfamily)
MTTAARDDFDRTFAELLPRLYRRALALSGSRPVAEDALHDAYLKLVAHPDRLTGHPVPYAYAFAAVISVLRDGWRRQREIPYDDLAEPAPEFAPSRWEAERETVRLLRLLSARQAAVVLLVDIDGYTIDQAAEALGLHRGTVSRTRGRALDKLRTVLATENEEQR